MNQEKRTRAINALLAYGYRQQQDGSFVQRKRDGSAYSQRWIPIEDGWRREDYQNSGALKPFPYTLHSSFEGYEGLVHENTPGAFVWEWPDDELIKVYEGASRAASA